MELTGDAPPAVPALVVGLAETDFTRIPDRSGWVNVQEVGGAIGSWKRSTGLGAYEVSAECVDEPYAVEPCDPGSGQSWRPPLDAVYTRDLGVREFIDQMWAPNDHEPWDKGAPEFKLFQPHDSGRPLGRLR